MSDLGSGALFQARVIVGTTLGLNIAKINTCPTGNFRARSRPPPGQAAFEIDPCISDRIEDFLTSAGKWLCIDVLPLQLFRARLGRGLVGTRNKQKQRVSLVRLFYGGLGTVR
jgi:hypothetical protein